MYFLPKQKHNTESIGHVTSDPDSDTLSTGICYAGTSPSNPHNMCCYVFVLKQLVSINIKT